MSFCNIYYKIEDVNNKLYFIMQHSWDYKQIIFIFVKIVIYMKHIKDLQTEIDSIRASVAALLPLHKDNEELRRAHAQLVYARGFSGKLLGLFGEKYPYPTDSALMTVKVASPDNFKVTSAKELFLVHESTTALIASLRAECNAVITDIEESHSLSGNVSKIKVFVTEMSMCLIKARFDLGWALHTAKDAVVTVDEDAIPPVDVEDVFPPAEEKVVKTAVKKTVKKVVPPVDTTKTAD